MYLLIFGIIIGRNWETIYETARNDSSKIANAIARTQAAITFYYMIEELYLAAERRLSRKATVFPPHSILCTCNRRSCKPLKIETYIRKLKAVS